jgi:ligand-binding sensor domain-containing protein
MIKQIYLAVFLPFLICSCKGQNNKNAAVGSISQLTNSASVQKESGFTAAMDSSFNNGFSSNTNSGINSSCELLDRSGNRWYGTAGNGVFRSEGSLPTANGSTSNAKARFLNFTQVNGLSSNTVFCMEQDNAGNIWFGTSNGACFYNGKEFVRLSIPGLDIDDSFLFGEQAGILNQPGANSLKKAVVRIIQDKKGSIWFGTAERGLFRYDGRLVSVQKPHESPAAAFTSFKFICSSTCRENRTDTEKYKAGNWQMMAADSMAYDDGLQLNNIGCLAEDKEGNIWFSAAGHKGVYRFDGIQFTHFEKYDGFDNDVCFGC